MTENNPAQNDPALGTTETASEADFAPIESSLSNGLAADLPTGLAAATAQSIPGIDPPTITSQEEFQADFVPLDSPSQVAAVENTMDQVGTADQQSGSMAAPLEYVPADTTAVVTEVSTTEAKIPSSDPSHSNPLTQVREYAEHVPASSSSIAAAYPFSLMIEGPLTEEEKEKLIDLLSRENMGIREVDLEPQFTSHRVLIPRISEYAGILIVQSLRGTQATLRFGPAEEIFASSDARANPPEVFATPEPQSTQTVEKHIDHPAEALPVTSDTFIPGFLNYKVLDVITASVALKSSLVEAAKSPQYQEALEALQRELKYRAHHKGASAILNYTIQLTPLDLPSHYRLMVSGTAVRGTSSVNPSAF